MELGGIMRTEKKIKFMVCLAETKLHFFDQHDIRTAFRKKCVLLQESCTFPTVTNDICHFLMCATYSQGV